VIAALEHSLQLSIADQPVRSSFTDEIVEFGLARAWGRVDEGSGRRGDRKAVPTPDVPVVNRGYSMESNPGSLATVMPDDEHVRLRRSGFDDPPEVKGGAITDQRWFTACKQRGVFRGEGRQSEVSNGVDASVERVQGS
jgi:hypothetical protein